MKEINQYMQEKRDENVLIWKTRNEELEIKSLKQLLYLLINVNQEDIDNEIKENLNNLFKWLKNNFPGQLELIEHLKTESKEFTSQQIRERVIRDLRKIIL